MTLPHFPAELRFVQGSDLNAMAAAINAAAGSAVCPTDHPQEMRLIGHKTLNVMAAAVNNILGYAAVTTTFPPERRVYSDTELGPLINAINLASSGGGVTPLLQAFKSTDGAPAPAFTPMAQSVMHAFAATSGSTGAKEILVDSAQIFQTMLGYGAAFTDGAGWVMKNYLSPETGPGILNSTAMALIADAYTTQGLNFIRYPMGDSDYTQRSPQAQVGDSGVKGTGFKVYVSDTDTGPSWPTFSMAMDDISIIPMVKAARAAAPNLKIMLAPWSPPATLKSGSAIVNGGSYVDNTNNNSYYANYRLLVQQGLYSRLGVYADYEEIQNEGGFTPTTYPGCDINGGNFVNIAAAMKTAYAAASVPYPKVLCGGWNYGDNASKSLINTPLSNANFAGAAWHPYSGYTSQIATDVVGQTTKERHLTEASIFNYADYYVPDFMRVSAAWYMSSIRQGMQSIFAWNFALAPVGQPGPYTDSGYPAPTAAATAGYSGGDMPLYEISSSGVVTKTRHFYALTHFSRFAPAGSKRIFCVTFGDQSTSNSTRADPDLNAVAFLRPDGNIAVVIVNLSASAIPFTIKDAAAGGMTSSDTLQPNQLATYVYTPPTAVASVPDAPIAKMVASTTAAQITFSLAAPCSYNGSAITSYDLEYGTTAGGESTTITGITPAQMAAGYVVAGLSLSQIYYGKIRARNTLGLSAWGSEASATTVATALYVQAATVQQFIAHPVVQLPAAPTVGNIMVVVSAADNLAGTPSGWTATGQWADASSQCIGVYYRVVQSGDTGIFTGTNSTAVDGSLTIFEFPGTSVPANVGHGTATPSAAHATATTPGTTSATGVSVAIIEWNTGGAPNASGLPGGSTLVYNYAGFSGGIYHGSAIAILPQAYIGSVVWNGSVSVTSPVAGFFTVG